MKTILPVVLGFISLSLSTNGAQIYSQNAVGYHTIETCSNGLFLIANSLNNGGNELNHILALPNWADGTTIYKFDSSTAYYRDAITFISGIGWLSPSDPNPTLAPGEGGWIVAVSNGAPRSVPITFVGEIPQGRLCQFLPGGGSLSLWSPPLGKGLETLSPGEGDTVYLYDCSPQPDYSIATYIEGFGWLSQFDPIPDGRRIEPGVAMFVQVMGPARSTCSTCFICTDAPAASGSSPIVLTNPAKEGKTFSFSFNSQVSETYQVQALNSVHTTSWSNLGAPIIATAASTLVVDTNAVLTAKFYRVVQGNP